MILTEAEAEIKLKNDGALPERPKTLSLQIEELLNLKNKPNSSDSGISQVGKGPSSGQGIAETTKKKRYHTKMTADKIKGLSKQTDEVSILVTVCSQEFMLQPNFVFE
jgi:hypothetical protein